MLNLKAIDDEAASKEPDEIYRWAMLFKAKSGEELKMAARNNEYRNEAVMTLHNLTADEKIQMQCEARKRYECDMATVRSEGRREGLEKGHQLGLSEGLSKGTVATLQSIGYSKSDIKKHLVSKSDMTPEEAEKTVSAYWKE